MQVIDKTQSSAQPLGFDTRQQNLPHPVKIARHSVEIKVPGWFGRSTLTIEVRVKQPETIHTVSNEALTAWLARRGARTPREVSLKARLNQYGTNFHRAMEYKGANAIVAAPGVYRYEDIVPA